jgi:hypothetical protein
MAIERELKAGDDALSKIRKLLPAEVSGAFLAINSIAPGGTEPIYLIVAAVVLAVACWFYLVIFANVTKVGQLIFVSGIAFPAWAANIAIERIPFFDEPNRWLAAGIIILVSVFIPIFVRPK